MIVTQGQCVIIPTDSLYQVKSLQPYKMMVTGFCPLDELKHAVDLEEYTRAELRKMMVNAVSMNKAQGNRMSLKNTVAKFKAENLDKLNDILRVEYMVWTSAIYMAHLISH